MSSIRVAAFELLDCRCQSAEPESIHGEQVAFHCELSVRDRHSDLHEFEGAAATIHTALAAAIAGLCTQAFEIRDFQRQPDVQQGFQLQVVVQGTEAESAAAGAGTATSSDEVQAWAIAILRAVNHAGLLSAAFRANNQKTLRHWAAELVEQWQLDLAGTPEAAINLNETQRLVAESIALEHFNRVASAAVVTATNHPRQDSVLGLYDTSAWLYDSNGRRRQECTDTNVWLAWYPPVDDDGRTVQEMMNSMPAAPKSAIPWIVRTFENPKGWLRFRGAVELDDHDVLHVLLGRGLQDQDEAFVLGFAMGTAKRGRNWQYWLFRWVLTRLYPEPYRIPKFLLPAFQLGVDCGNETGLRNLYAEDLQTLLELPISEARQRMQVDMDLVRTYFDRERRAIPTTIASLRLP